MSNCRIVKICIGNDTFLNIANLFVALSAKSSLILGGGMGLLFAERVTFLQHPFSLCKIMPHSKTMIKRQFPPWKFYLLLFVHAYQLDIIYALNKISVFKKYE